MKIVKRSALHNFKLVIIKSTVSSSKYSVFRVFSGDDLYSNTSLLSASSTQALLFQSPGTVFMMIGQDDFLSTCFDGFFFGKISVLFFTL